MPTETSLEALAPEKRMGPIRVAMGRIRSAREEAKESPRAPRFAPAGQSTQMIVGADASSDATILATASTLYASYGLKRVYYSAYSPIPSASSKLPGRAPPLMREHRLYQADWLMRHYGFAADEIAPAAGGALDLDIDPKLAWALAHPERFPVDVNRAEREALLRVPGIGVRNVERILAARRARTLRYDDLVRLRCDMDKAKAFVTTLDWRPRAPAQRSTGAEPREQLALW
jgi:predicted DNA-binding helix-hairpin-helix protein